MGRTIRKTIFAGKPDPDKQHQRDKDTGVSEIFGAIILIGIVTVCVTIVGVYYITRPAMELTPAVKVTVTNATGPLQICHAGGDALVYSRITLFYNGQTATNLFNTTGNTQSWVIGDVLTYTGSAKPQSVSVYYKGNTQSYLIFSTNDIPVAYP